ncbi:MAG: AraC family transcriptional regulator, partial [Lachnospiraceae bacterium]|nr:AraC family transcriptional regulator [Lachnospiraceae bacterium]
HQRSGNDYLQKAVLYIKNNYHKNITVQDIADYVGINRSYLYRLFMQEFSISPKNYIFDYRFHMATDLLSNTDMTVSAIALSCGFKDVSAFCSQFRKSTGFTPKQYRTIDGARQMTWKTVDD